LRFPLRLLLLLLPGASAAGAFTVSSVITEGCHERISSDALREVRLELATAAPLPTDANEQALVGDLQFSPSADMTDLGGVSLLLGVRDNDLKGRSSTDLTELALVQGDPNAQEEHCLRNLDDKEPGGTQSAWLSCRSFIHQRVVQALDGLDAAGAPDPSQRMPLTVYLALRHGVNASLPIYYVRMGQALHAVQDSFTHSYRTPDAMRVTVLLDWIDASDGTLVESRDGPPHSTQMDRCDDPDPLRTRRRQLATAASAALLRATLDPALRRDQKIARVEEALDRYLGYAPGCTYQNHWCDAPEHALGNVSLFGCGSAGAGWACAIGIAALLLRRRGRRAGRQTRASAAALLIALSLAAPALGAESDEHGPPPPLTQPVVEPGPSDPTRITWGGSLAAGGALDNGALAFALGARLRAAKSWSFGLDAEWNPWLAYNGTLVRGGVFNFYGTAMFRVPLAYERFNLRIAASLGLSRLLINLYGAPVGSTGVYFAFNPLALEWKISRLFYLVTTPLGFAMAAPQLRGVPLVYSQYRTTVALEMYVP